MKVEIGKYPEDDEEREISIHIDDFDVWSADNTLALIILPVLVKLKEVKHGSPSVKDKDVPKDLRSDIAPGKEEWDLDALFFARWDWVMDEMIWAFEQLINLEDFPDKRIQDRIDNGLRLFGKYYQALWD